MDLRLDKIPQSTILLQREYPKLWAIMQNIDINQFSRTPNIYFGTANLFKPSFYAYTAHSHRFNISGDINVNITINTTSVGTNYFQFNGLSYPDSTPHNSALGYLSKTTILSTDIENSFSTNSAVMINKNIDDGAIRPNSYSQNVYILADIFWE